jgi:SAM-dependent methyltransferase
MNNQNAEEIMEVTKKTYELIGSEFSDTRDRIWPEMEELVKKYVKKRDRVLDVGCGNGRLFEILPEVEYLGVDMSEALLRENKGKTQKLDILKLDEIIGEFDVIFCFASFNHVAGGDNRLKVLNDIFKLLKSGGIVAMTNWNMWQRGVKKSYWKSRRVGFKDVMTTWKSRDGKKEGDIYYRALTRGELKRLFKKSGFKVLENFISEGKRNIVSVGRK